jgi:phage terminase large subunit
VRQTKVSKIQIDFDESVINKCYLELLDNQSRYLILYGGAGSGKSVFAAQKLILRMLEEKNHKFLIVRKVAKTLRESTFSLLKSVIGDWGLSHLFEINKSEMTITCSHNGNQIIHAGLDDVEKMKSIHGITGLWIEEASEVEQQDFQQLDLRLRGMTSNYKQIIISFNPITSLNWLKSVFFDKTKKNSSIKHTTYLDNEFIDDSYKEVLESMKEDDPYYYMVYALGHWGVVGKTIFSAQKVTERIAALRDKKPIKQGFFIFDYRNEKIIDSTIKWIEDKDGYIKIYEDVQSNVPYVLGADTSGNGSDYFASHVINNITGNQAAVFHNQLDEDLFTRQIYCLGKYYNTALIGLESNFSTYPINEIKRLGYRKQFVRETPDTYTGKLQKRYGFHTNMKTRPEIIANLVKLVRDNIGLINDMGTLNEMLTFVRNEKGRAEAQQGKHDDLIISLAISHYIRKQQDSKYIAVPIDKKPLPFPFQTDEQDSDVYMSW